MAFAPDAKRIAVIPGDGAGIDVTAEAVKALRAVAAVSGLPLALEHFDWSADRYLRDGATLPPGAAAMLAERFDAILFGALGDPRVPDNRHAAEILLGLRFQLDLYVNARPCELLDRRLTPLRDRGERDLDFIIFRENTEGLYVNIGGVFKRGTADEVAVQEQINTRKGVERILRYAFEYAGRCNRTRLVMADKSNALPHGHGLWQRVFAELRPQYPAIEARHLYVDALAAEMVRDPSQFQVIVTSNLLGDILSDLGASLVGGMGVAPSGNLHPGRISLFEPVHGSAPNIAGKNLANPVGSVLSAAMMLEEIGRPEEAEAIRDAVRASVRERKTTGDLGGSMGTREVGDWIAEALTLRGVPRPGLPDGR
ncbi:MAG TPA: isocitrate/isopropylmalate dehydrogenase family protein [Candidatus Acidoferrales bacterium]|nr:isocitrate/isopropylmalate dehydrogenase family protein [Candidatus Acidoferrales bacterium]